MKDKQTAGKITGVQTFSLKFLRHFYDYCHFQLIDFLPALFGCYLFQVWSSWRDTSTKPPLYSITIFVNFMNKRDVILAWKITSGHNNSKPSLDIIFSLVAWSHIWVDIQSSKTWLSGNEFCPCVQAFGIQSQRVGKEKYKNTIFTTSHFLINAYTLEVERQRWANPWKSHDHSHYVRSQIHNKSLTSTWSHLQLLRFLTHL